MDLPTLFRANKVNLDQLPVQYNWLEHFRPPPPFNVGLVYPPRPHNTSMDSFKKCRKYFCIVFSGYYWGKNG